MIETAAFASSLVLVAGVVAAVVVWIDRTIDRAGPRSDWLDRRAGRVLTGLALLPIAWLASFALVAGRARVQLGRWPELAPLRLPWEPADESVAGAASDSFGIAYGLGAALLFPAFFSLAAYAPIAWRAHVERIAGLRRAHASFAVGYGSLLAV